MMTDLKNKAVTVEAAKPAPEPASALCPKCKQPARAHYTAITGGVRADVYHCDRCGKINVPVKDKA